MKLKIESLMSLQSSEVEITGLTVIAGGNGAGKSTILKAAAMLACREDEHFVDASGKGLIQRGKTSSLVKHGNTKSTAVLDHNGRSFAASYPTNKSAGDLILETSPLLCGRVAWSAMDVKQRLQYIKSVTGDIIPTKEEFMSAANASGVSEELITNAWLSIATSGWDQAHASTLKSATGKRGEWKGITGETYGNVKAATWGNDFTGDLDDAKKALSDATQAYENAIGVKAISEAEIANMREIAATDPTNTNDLEASLKDAEERIQNKRVELFKMNKEHAERLAEITATLIEVPAKGAERKPDGYCPACGYALELKNETVKLFVADEKDADIDTKVAAAIEHNRAVQKNLLEFNNATSEKREDIEKQGKKISKEIEDLKEKIAIITAENAKIIQARIDLEQAASQPKIDVEATRKARDDAEHVLTMLKVKKKAAAVHAEIEDITKIAPILAGDGLRAAKMKEKFSLFTNLVEQVSRALTVSVTLDENYLPVLSGVTYHLLSDGQKLLADIFMQLVFCLHSKPDLLVIDKADTLDSVWRSKVCRAANIMAHNTLMAITCKEDDAKKMVPHEMFGAVYFVRQGTAERFK